jgi:hypothetical protein
MSNEHKDWLREQRIDAIKDKHSELCMEYYVEYSPAPKEGYCKLPKGHEGEHEFQRVYDFVY